MVAAPVLVDLDRDSVAMGDDMSSHARRLSFPGGTRLADLLEATHPEIENRGWSWVAVVDGTVSAVWSVDHGVRLLVRNRRLRAAASPIPVVFRYFLQLDPQWLHGRLAADAAANRDALSVESAPPRAGGAGEAALRSGCRRARAARCDDRPALRRALSVLRRGRAMGRRAFRLHDGRLPCGDPRTDRVAASPRLRRALARDGCGGRVDGGSTAFLRCRHPRRRRFRSRRRWRPGPQAPRDGRSPARTVTSLSSPAKTPWTGTASRSGARSTRSWSHSRSEGSSELSCIECLSVGVMFVPQRGTVGGSLTWLFPSKLRAGAHVRASRFAADMQKITCRLSGSAAPRCSTSPRLCLSPLSVTSPACQQTSPHAGGSSPRPPTRNTPQSGSELRC